MVCDILEWLVLRLWSVCSQNLTSDSWALLLGLDQSIARTPYNLVPPRERNFWREAWAVPLGENDPVSGRLAFMWKYARLIPAGFCFRLSLLRRFLAEIFSVQNLSSQNILFLILSNEWCPEGVFLITKELVSFLKPAGPRGRIP